jgi:hypothetical protein
MPFAAIVLSGTLTFETSPVRVRDDCAVTIEIVELTIETASMIIKQAKIFADKDILDIVFPH